MSAGVHVTRTFERMSRELYDCEAAGRRIEAAVADLHGPAGARTPAASRHALQELDSLVQRLRDLSAFTAVLGSRPEIGPPDIEEAFRALKLDRVRAALSGIAPSDDEAENETFF